MSNHLQSTAEIQFKLYGGTGSRRQAADATTPKSGSGQLPRVTQVMALALYFQDMIERGEVRDYADLARLGCVSRERISQVMELIWLAPSIEAEILALPAVPGGRHPISECALRKIAARLSWAEQEVLWMALKKRIRQ